MPALAADAEGRNREEGATADEPADTAAEGSAGIESQTI